jgi:hypothetical protein
MTAAEKESAAEERRRRALDRACERLQLESTAKIYGAVTLHMQAGLVVRVVVEQSHKISDP